MQDINLVLEYKIVELPAPVPSVHNDILSDFRSCESGELPGALAIALERAESAHRANLERLTAIRGTRVQINLNLGNIPRIFVRLSALSERLLALSDSDTQHAQPYRDGMQALTAKIKQQQRALTGALFTLDRMVRLYGRHILLQSYTTHFLRDPVTQERVSQGRKPSMTGLSTTAFSLAEEEWTLATPASIAQARGEGNSRTRLQEPFAIIPMPHRAFPLHCQSNRVSLEGVSRYVPLKAHTVYDDRPVRFTIYGWSHCHQDSAVLEGIHQLMNLGYVLTDLSPFRTQKNTNIRSIRLTSNVMHDQLWQCLLCRLIELPSGIPSAIKAVVPDPSPSDPPMYHTWGVLNPDYPAFEPSQFPLELEKRFEERDIHLLFNPQRLRPEWLDTISVSGVCDIVFRSTSSPLRWPTTFRRWPPPRNRFLPFRLPFLLSRLLLALETFLMSYIHLTLFLCVLRLPLLPVLALPSLMTCFPQFVRKLFILIWAFPPLMLLVPLFLSRIRP